MALMSGLSAVLIACSLLWTDNLSFKVSLTATLIILIAWLGFAFALRQQIIRPLQTISNLLAALREEDFTIRAHVNYSEDALGQVLSEVNALGEILREQRLGALEATALLQTVMAQIDVAIFAFDSQANLRLVNRAGENLLGQQSEDLLGRNAAAFGLIELLNEEEPQTVQMTFPSGASGRWGVSHGKFRQNGLPHLLLVISNLSRALREEERLAWQRLVRVLGHELNNSLAPIKSIAESLADLLARQPLPNDWNEDARHGLSIIAGRADNLSRFMEAYAKLAKLPPPRLAPLDVEILIRRSVKLETRMVVKVQSNAPVIIQADENQLEQLLINLLRNAVDAASETAGGGVTVGWRKAHQWLEIYVEDEGLGIANNTNLFVPFFTTKPNGSGIGLVISRQIAEAHGGSLTLRNRAYGSGCEAILRLPLNY